MVMHDLNDLADKFLCCVGESCRATMHNQSAHCEQKKGDIESVKRFQLLRC